MLSAHLSIASISLRSTLYCLPQSLPLSNTTCCLTIGSPIVLSRFVSGTLPRRSPFLSVTGYGLDVQTISLGLRSTPTFSLTPVNWNNFYVYISIDLLLRVVTLFSHVQLPTTVYTNHHDVYHSSRPSLNSLPLLARLTTAQLCFTSY